jgi:predicted nucleic acid-binding protein
MPVLDTTFLIDLEEGLPEAAAALGLLQGQELVVPGHAAFELMAGTDTPLALLAGLRNSYHVRMATDRHLVAGAEIRRRLARTRRRPSWGDLYIAAEAVVSSTYVVTADARDFKAMGCRVWEYRKGGAPPA